MNPVYLPNDAARRTTEFAFCIRSFYALKRANAAEQGPGGAIGGKTSARIGVVPT
jgi:hypothetical protein